MPYQCKKCGMVSYTYTQPTNGCPANNGNAHDWWHFKQPEPKVIVQETEPDYDKLAASIKQYESQQAYAQLEAKRQAEAIKFRKERVAEYRAEKTRRRKIYQSYNADIEKNIESIIKNADSTELIKIFETVVIEFKSFTENILLEFVGYPDTGTYVDGDILIQSLSRIFNGLTIISKWKDFPLIDAHKDFEKLANTLAGKNVFAFEINGDTEILNVRLYNPIWIEHLENKHEKTFSRLTSDLAKIGYPAISQSTTAFLRNNCSIMIQNFHKLLIKNLPAVVEYGIYMASNELHMAQEKLKKSIAKGYRFDDLRNISIEMFENFRVGAQYLETLKNNLTDILEEYDMTVKRLKDRFQQDAKIAKAADIAADASKDEEDYKRGKEWKEKKLVLLLIFARFAIIGLMPIFTLLAGLNLLFALIISIAASVGYEYMLREVFLIGSEKSNSYLVFPAISSIIWLFVLPNWEPFLDWGLGYGGISLNYGFLFGFMCLKVFLSWKDIGGVYTGDPRSWFRIFKGEK